MRVEMVMEELAGRAMTIEILPIRHEHIESFHRAVDIVARERQFLAMTEAPPLAKTQAFVANNIAQGFPQFVAIDAGHVVGWCDIKPIEMPLYAHGGVLGMALRPAFRGRGLGERLVTTTLTAARTFGLKRVELTVRGDNDRAIRLYERVGFVREGERRNAVLLDGNYKNIVLMAIIDLDRWRVPAPKAQA